MAKAKRYTHIGTVSTDTSQHIVREPSGRLSIVRRKEDTNWVEYTIGRLTVSYARRDPATVMINTGSHVSMNDLTEAVRLSTFLHHHLQAVGQGA